MLDRLRFISVPWVVRWSPVLVLLIAAFFRLDDLSAQSFWNDEGTTLRLIQRDIGPMLEAVEADIHPPGYYLVLKGWAALVGENEFGLRALSAMWGVLTVAFTYALGARLYARGAGVLAAGLVALSPFAVYYSQEARMYAQLAALSVMGVYLLAVLVQTAPRGRRFAGLALSLAAVNALGLYTHYTYPLTMLAQGLFFAWWWLGAGARHPRALGIFVAANLLTLAAFAPWLPIALDQITAWPSDDTGVVWGDKLTTIAAYLTFGNTAVNPSPADYFWPGLLLLAWVLPDYYRRPPGNAWRAWLPWVWIGLVAGALLISGAYREANLKFLLPAQIALALLLGRGGYLLWDVGSSSAATPQEMVPRLIAALALGFTFGAVIGYLDDLRNDLAYQRDDYRRLAARVAAASDPADAVILNGPGQYDVFSYYYDGPATIHPLPRGYGGDDAATREDTLAIIENAQDIFVVYWGEGERDPNDIVRETLSEHTFQLFSRWYGDVRLVQYGVLASPPDTPQTPLDGVRFGDAITLNGYSLSGDLRAGAAAGEVVGVTLYWQTDAPLTTRYKVFVQLLSPDGALVAQHDSEPANNRRLTPTWEPGETIIDNHGIRIPPGLAAGDYTLIAGLYDLNDPAVRLPVREDDYLILERLSIR